VLVVEDSAVLVVDSVVGNREQAAGSAIPGDYQVVLTLGDLSVTKTVKVHYDPRIDVNMADLRAKQAFEDDMLKMSQDWSKITNRVSEAAGVIEKVEAQMKNAEGEQTKELKKALDSLQQKFNEVREITTGLPRDRSTQGIARSFTPTAGSWIGQASRYAGSRLTAPGKNERDLKANAEKMMADALEQVNTFFRNEWPKFKAVYDATDLSYFKDFSDPINK